MNRQQLESLIESGQLSKERVDLADALSHPIVREIRGKELRNEPHHINELVELLEAQMSPLVHQLMVWAVECLIPMWENLMDDFDDWVGAYEEFVNLFRLFHQGNIQYSECNDYIEKLKEIAIDYPRSLSWDSEDGYDDERFGEDIYDTEARISDVAQARLEQKAKAGIISDIARLACSFFGAKSCLEHVSDLQRDYSWYIDDAIGDAPHTDIAHKKIRWRYQKALIEHLLSRLFPILLDPKRDVPRDLGLREFKTPRLLQFQVVRVTK